MYSYCIKIEDRSYFIKTMLRHIVPSWNARGKSISPSVYLREQWFRHLSLLLGASACSEQAQRELCTACSQKEINTLGAFRLLAAYACLFIFSKKNARKVYAGHSSSSGRLLSPEAERAISGFNLLVLVSPACMAHDDLPCPPMYVAFSWSWRATQWWQWKPSWTARASSPSPRQASELKFKVAIGRSFVCQN